MKRSALAVIALVGLIIPVFGATEVRAETLQSPADPVIVTARDFGGVRFSSANRSTTIVLSDEVAGCTEEDPNGPVEALIRVIDQVSDASSHHVVFQYNVQGSCDPAGTCSGTESSSLVSVSFNKRTMKSRNLQIQPIQDCGMGFSVKNLSSSEWKAPVVGLSGGRVRVVSERSNFTGDKAFLITVTTGYVRRNAAAGISVQLKQREL
jgi:hypothetical protein